MNDYEGNISCEAVLKWVELQELSHLMMVKYSSV